MTKNKRFELQWSDTGEMLVDNKTGNKHYIYSPQYRFHVRYMMNELSEENDQLKTELRNLRRLANELYMEGSE